MGEKGQRVRATRWLRPLSLWVRKPVEDLVGISEIDRRCASLSADTLDAWLEQAQETLGIRYRLCGALEQIPQEGPVVVVANHPYGGLEGIVLAHLLRQVRPDCKLLVNFLLARFSVLNQMFISVDPFERSDSRQKNAKPLRESVRWLRGGGVLGIFPAGEVAHWRLRDWRVCEPPWSPNAARLARMTGATVVPIHFSGGNGPLFQLAGLVHPRLRTALLPRQLLNKAGLSIDVHVGQPVSPAQIGSFDTAESCNAFLRLSTQTLAPRASRPQEPLPQGQVSEPLPIIEPVPKEELVAELATLPPERLLLSSQSYRVYFAKAGEVPGMMTEIARVREVTFRAAHEGTGRSLDRDAFDEYYTHLFVWDTEDEALVGAYRLGPTDEILPRFGRKGLYSSTLFRFPSGFPDDLGPSIELGRSFVSLAYQKGYQPLQLLWKGIGAYVVRHPQVRYLFGPVSISCAYQPESRELMASVLSAHLRAVGIIRRAVRPRKPLAVTPGNREILRDITRGLDNVSALSGLIGCLEPDHKGIPVLLRQYLKLGAKMLAFNRDPAFNDALDGLGLVDLPRANRKVLAKYLPADGLDAYIARHADG